MSIVKVRINDDFIVLQSDSSQISVDDVKKIDSTLKKLAKKDKFILFDFQNVVAVNTSAIEELINLKNKLITSNLECAIINVQAELYLIFYITKLVNYIDFYNSEQEVKFKINRRRLKLVSA